MKSILFGMVLAYVLLFTCDYIAVIKHGRESGTACGIYLRQAKQDWALHLLAPGLSAACINTELDAPDEKGE